jgi:hypothetical protein
LLFWRSRSSKLVLISNVLLGAAALWAVSVYVQWQTHWWWSWIGPVFGQTGTALVYVLFYPKPDPYIAFISYRTESDGDAAARIEAGLNAMGLRTFIDAQSLTAGRFDEQLLLAIENAKYFLLILSKESLARCVEPDDWVLRELTHALSQGKPILPIFKGEFRFDAEEAVPDLPAIRALRRYQGITYSSRDFDGFMRRLGKLMEAPPHLGGGSVDAAKNTCRSSGALGDENG